MTDMQIIMWMMGGLATLMLFIWSKMDKRFELMEQKFDTKFTLLQETVTDIDRRLCRLEGTFASKDCCMIKDHHHKSDAG